MGKKKIGNLILHYLGTHHITPHNNKLIGQAVNGKRVNKFLELLALGGAKCEGGGKKNQKKEEENNTFIEK